MLSTQAGGSAAQATTLASRLLDRGFVVLPERYRHADRAWGAADRVIQEAATDDELCRRIGPLAVVADYTMPPPGVVQRAFQVLHLDFGVPLAVAAQVDVARYTVLHVNAAASRSGVATRIVPLAALGSRRDWPAPVELAAALRTRADDPDSTEGVLARIVEAADGTAQLPSKVGEDFRCGLEFDAINAEYRYFLEHGIDLRGVERQIVLDPGQTLIFDNLRCAHGRLGLRATGELHQHCVGFVGVTQDEQRTILLHVLAGLTRAA